MSIADVWDKHVERNNALHAVVLSDSIVWYKRGQVQTTQQLTNKQIMDLMSAKKAAIEQSRKEKGKKLYLNVDDQGEVKVSESYVRGSSGFCYKNGSEIALPEDSTTPEPRVKGKKRIVDESAATAPRQGNESTKEYEKRILKNKKTVATENANTMATAKKSTKKAAKKTTKRETVKHTPKPEWGKKVNISIKDMRAGIRKGFQYRDPQGVFQTEKYMATRANQDYVREGMYVSKAEKK